MLLNKLSSPGIVELDTSPNEAWKPSLEPVWTAALKIKARKIQHRINHVTFFDQCAALSIAHKEDRVEQVVREMFRWLKHILK